MGPGVERLSSDEVGRNLVYAGLFLVAYELIKHHVVAHVAGIYTDTEFGPGMPFKNYEEDVRSRHRNRFEASLLFLRDRFGALTSEQVLGIQAVLEHRNVLAHELPERIVSLDPAENESLLKTARDALFVLDNLWTKIDVMYEPGFPSTDPEALGSVHSNYFALLDQVIEKTRAIRLAPTQPRQPGGDR